MIEKTNLPKGWELKKLGEVCYELFAGGDVPKNNYSQNYCEEYSIPIYANGEKNKGLYGYTNIPKVDYPAITISARGTIGLTEFRTIPFYPIVRLIVLKPNKFLHPLFLKYAIDNINIKHTGSSIPQLTVPTVKNLIIPIAPLSEQTVIVAKIEELLSDLENGKQQLLTAQAQLKVYRQSLLKWAFEGKLTNKNVKEGELPEGWTWVTMGSVCTKIGDIDHKMPKQLSEGYPYVSTKDFTNDLKISFDNAKYISEEDYLNLSRKIKPERGDIIFPRYGTIGKNILIDFDKEFLVSYSCAVLKPNKDLVLSKYVYLYSLSPKISEEIRKYVVETTQANVGIASIKSFVFPLPSLKEQTRIVEELESKLTVCDKIEETISQSLAQSETLRQSILKKAFEGKLV